MAQLPSYAEVLRKKPERLDPNDYSGKVKYLPRWPKIHPDYKPEHLNKPEHQWVFGHPVMILSKEPSEKGNVDVFVLRTFQGRGLQAEHGNSLQSRFYMPIHAALPYPLTGHPFTGHPIIHVLYLINPEYRILKNCWVNLKRTFTLPYHCLEDFMGADNRTIPTLMRTAYRQMVVYERDVVPGLMLLEEAEREEAEREEAEREEAEREEAQMEATEMEEVEMEQADTDQADADTKQAEMDDVISILVGSETSSTGISSGTVSFGGSSSEVSPSEVSPSEVSPSEVSTSQGLSSQGLSSQGVSSQGVSSQGVSSQGVSSQGSSFEGSSVEGSSMEGSSCDGPPPDAPPPDGSSSECPTSEPHTSDGSPS